MKSFLIFILFSYVISLSAQAEEVYGNSIECPVIDLSGDKQSGQTLLSFIKSDIKPELDHYATEGYPVASGDVLVYKLDFVDKKVRRQVLSSLHGKDSKEKIESLKKIGDALEGEVVTLYNLPNKIAHTKLAKNRYKLSTYIGLASCGGVSLKLANDNYAYNIHYGTGTKEKDKQTGRSFGASRIYAAIDSSYTHYLRSLEEYVVNSPKNIKYFASTIMETLTNTQPTKYNKVNDHGDSVLTDFLAIWIAEQTRNLMDGKVHLHWDAALFQITMLSVFHSGQEKIKLFYKDPLTQEVSFTDTTYKLAWPNKNHIEKSCDVDLESRDKKEASLTDYIGVHYKFYEHCGRSGINMSKREWTLLSQEITTYLLNDKKGSVKVETLREAMKAIANRNLYYNNDDIFREIARFLISDKTPEVIENWKEVSKKIVDVLEYVRTQAPEITKSIEEHYGE